MGASTTRSYTSDHIEGGYTDRAIHLNTAEVGVQIAELVADAATRLADNDPTNDRQAFADLATISEKASQLSHMAWTAADGNRAAAKKLAKNMVENGRTR